MNSSFLLIILKFILLLWINIYTVSYAIYEGKGNRPGAVFTVLILFTADISALFV